VDAAFIHTVGVALRRRVSSGSLARAAPGVHPAATPAQTTALQRHLRVSSMWGALPGTTAMWRLRSLLPAC